MTDLWAAQRAAVRVALDARGMTQADLARELRLSEKHVSQLLAGRADGSAQMWARIATAVGCTWALTVVGRPNSRARWTGER